MAVRTPKGAQTRARILEVALVLFKLQGYEKTTMRRIAREAGVSLGSTYYYFQSKEHLIQAFYYQLYLSHEKNCQALLVSTRDLKSRLTSVLKAKLELSAPYHGFSVVIFRAAIDPRSPLNPFSPESEPLRLDSIRLMREVLEGSGAGARLTLERELPILLWLYELGITLYWAQDYSEKRRDTFHLLERTADIVCWIVRFSNIPLMRPLLRSLCQLVTDIHHQIPKKSKQIQPQINPL